MTIRAVLSTLLTTTVDLLWNGTLVFVYLGSSAAVSLPMVTLPGVFMWWAWGRLGLGWGWMGFVYFLGWLVVFLRILGVLRTVLLTYADLLFAFWRGDVGRAGNHAGWR